MRLRLPRPLAEVTDDLIAPIFIAGGLSALGLIAISRTVNSQAAHRLDGAPLAGPLVSGIRSAIGQIVDPSKGN